jgi:hypothetical protein
LLLWLLDRATLVPYAWPVHVQRLYVCNLLP